RRRWCPLGRAPSFALSFGEITVMLSGDIFCSAGSLANQCFHLGHRFQIPIEARHQCRWGWVRLQAPSSLLRCPSLLRLLLGAVYLGGRWEMIRVLLTEG